MRYLVLYENERERLIELLNDATSVQYYNGDQIARPEMDIDDDDIKIIANYLLENGVVVLLRDGNDFNTDLYCPYCGNNLSNTRVLNQEAEQALKGGNKNE